MVHYYKSFTKRKRFVTTCIVIGKNLNPFLSKKKNKQTTLKTIQIWAIAEEYIVEHIVFETLFLLRMIEYDFF